MAYRFKLDERFQDGLVRIGMEQMRRVATELEAGTSPKAVHEARKAIKRLRALLQLVRPALPEAKFAAENKRLRGIARIMSGARDATVVRGLAARLAMDAKPDDKALLARLSHALTSGDSRVAAGPEDGAHISRLIGEAEREWRRLRLDEDGFNGFNSIGLGLGRVYRRCAKAAASAWGEHADAAAEDRAFHDCRKAVQQHWRHMRLLSHAWPDALAARERQAHEVSEILGEAQDITVLISHIDRVEDDGKLDAQAAKQVRKLARRRQKALRAAARPRLERLIAERAGDHVRRIELYWRSAAKIAAIPFDQPEVTDTGDRRGCIPERQTGSRATHCGDAQAFAQDGRGRDEAYATLTAPLETNAQAQPVVTPSPPAARVMEPVAARASASAAARPAVRAALPDATPGSFRVEIARTAAELSRHVEAWDALSREAIEPNVFLEPWQLLHAIEAFGGDKRSLFLMVMRAPVHPERGERMVGFLALERETHLRCIPTRLARSWRHPHLVLSTPLLDRRYAGEAWGALLAWLADHPEEASVLELELLLAEGPSHHALIDNLRQRRLPWLPVDHFTRAALDVRRPGDSGLEGSLSSGARKELRRQRRRLAEQGQVELKVLAAGEDAAPWVEAFLELEARGWKGRAGTAFNKNDSDSDYFRRICRDGHARGQLQMLALELDGRPVAMKCNFCSGRQTFCLKIAFDERFAPYSPGVLLELDNIAVFRGQQIIDKIDSCAIADHGMINRLWSGRRSLAHVLISTGRRKGNFALALFAALRGLKQTVRPPRARADAPES